VSWPRCRAGRRDDQKELVGADASERLALLLTGLEPLRNGDEQRVAGGVAQRVVHQPEAIEVDIGGHGGVARNAGTSRYPEDRPPARGA
jgi:hypothetical protein